MTAGWVPVFDQSFKRVPASRLHEMYAAGFRVMAGYAGGGSSTKWLTVAEITTWLALGDDTAVAALFEIAGTEPIDNPASGDDHAKEARAAWRARGYPDAAGISPAVDENVTVAEARDQLTTYFGHWKAADTALPIPYVEKDAGAVLKAAGVSAGTFTPAAFSWDPDDTLTTPANAPAHVIWTQEHNGKALAGGVVDVGHIRTSAPIWWKEASAVTSPVDLSAKALGDITQIFIHAANRDTPDGRALGNALSNLQRGADGYTTPSPPSSAPGASFLKPQLDAITEAVAAIPGGGDVDEAALAAALAPLVAPLIAAEILAQLNLRQVDPPTAPAP